MGVLIDVVLQAGRYKGEFEKVPDYKLAFKPLWSMSDSEQADVDQKKAATELTKAQTAQVYVDMQALDVSEVRKRLAEDGEFTVNDILDEGEVDWNSIDAGGIGGESEETSGTALSAEQDAPDETADDSADVAVRTAPTGCGVIVIKDGRILAGTREDNGLTCGPGGHIEPGETPEEAAIRETREEFGIYAANIIPLAVIDGMPDGYCPSQVFLCTEFYGTPNAFNNEMEDARFMTMAELHNEELFLPFELSIKELARQLANSRSENIDGGPGSGRKSEGEKEDEPLKNSENSGIIYANKKISSYIAVPKTLGDSTHKEKYDDFRKNNVDVKPLGKGNHKGVPYEEGGGYRVNGSEDGQYLQYHPENKSHHQGEYYKLSSGKTGSKRYDMSGNLKPDE
jgi:8-oxo-dGTP pyrophosphatase MutT (NUDIX family)